MSMIEVNSDVRLIAELPRSVYRGPEVPRDLKDDSSRLSFLRLLRRKPAETVPAHNLTRTEQSFNAALWLRFRKPYSGTVAFILLYRDQKGEHQVQVDQGSLSSSTNLMLSGRVTLSVYGELEYMAACCRGLDAGQGFVVDELFVQRDAQATAGQKGLRRA